MKTEKQKAIDIIRDMSDFEKALIYALGTIESLLDKGLLGWSGDYEYLTASGMVLFREIIDSGFKPDSELLHAAVLSFKASDSEQDEQLPTEAK